MLRFLLNTRKPYTTSNNRIPIRETNERIRTRRGTRPRTKHGESQPKTTNTVQTSNTQTRRKKQHILSQP